MNDLDLARRVLAGDDSAAHDLFTDYFPRLYRFARPRLRENEDATEEVVQTTLIKAVRKLHTYRGEAALFTWMCTICRREIAAWQARTGAGGEVTLLEDHVETRAALDAIAAAAANPEIETGRREIARLVQVTLDALPARYASILEWRYIQGFAVDEIAARLDLGYKATESLLSRARQAFRDAFAVTTGVWQRQVRPEVCPEE